MSPIPNTGGPCRSSSSSSNSNNQVSHRHKTSQSQHEDFTEETFNIVKYVIYFVLQGGPTNSSPSPQAKRFRELVEEILNKHDVYDCICGNLQITPSNVEQILHGVVENMFQDDVINWGRLVSLVGFSVKVAEHLRAYGNHDDAVIELTSDILVRKTGAWIVPKGGWVDVVTHFASKQCEASRLTRTNDSWIKGILVTATATIGLGALLAVTCK